MTLTVSPLPERAPVETHASAARGWWTVDVPGLLRSVFAPAPRLTLSEWSDKYAVLSREDSSEPGQWRTSRAPYLREIMDELSNPEAEEVVWVAGSQLGKTALGKNLVGFHIHQDPAPILMVQPSLSMAESWSKDRLAPMVRDSPVLRGRLRDPRSRDSGNTILHKSFDGGHITVVGANSAAGLASRPIRVLILDEIDRYPDSAGTEGDPVELATARTRTFWNRRIFKVSSPGNAPPDLIDDESVRRERPKGTSRIWPDLLVSDYRRYYVPCPHCNTEQLLEFESLIWAKEIDERGRTVHHPETAAYRCAHCAALIEEHQRPRMLASGRWVRTNPNGRMPGFHLNSLYSPWMSWQEVAETWLRAQGNVQQLKTFVNTVLARLWKEENREITTSTLDARRESWGVDVPNGVGAITCAVDVQGDRLEVAVWGWGEGEQSWLLTHQRLYGDPEALDVPGIPSVWSRLEALRTRTWRHESGRDTRIWVTMIDARYLSKVVFDYVRGRESAGVYACFGDDAGKGKRPIARPQKPNRYGVRPWTIETPPAKDALFRRLKLLEPGPGYIHFCGPTETGADAEFMAQWAGEVAEWKREGGQLVRKYKRVRRNEAIDLYVYGRAALHTLGPVVTDRLAVLAAELAGDSSPPQPRRQRGRVLYDPTSGNER